MICKSACEADIPEDRPTEPRFMYDALFLNRKDIYI